MEPDARIEALVSPGADIHAALPILNAWWNADGVAISHLNQAQQVYFPTTAEEVGLVMPGVKDPAPAAMDVQARQVAIQHADVVNGYTTAAE